MWYNIETNTKIDDWELYDLLYEAFDEYYDDSDIDEYIDSADCNNIEIFGVKYNSSAVLKKCDPVFYNEIREDFIDGIVNGTIDNINPEEGESLADVTVSGATALKNIVWKEEAE